MRTTPSPSRKDPRRAWRRCRAFLPSLLLLPALLLAAGPARPAAPPLRVAIDDNYPPFIFKDDGGAIQGILVDRWQAWARATGRPVEINAMDWGEAQRRMAAGEFDVIDTIFRNPEREALYTFSPPYARIEVPVFFRREISGIVDLASLKGFPVAAKTGDHAVLMLREAGVTDILLHPNYESIVRAAARGQVNVFLVDAPPALYFLNKFGLRDEFRRTGPLYSGEFHRAVRKGDEARLAAVEAGFAALPAELLRRIDEKWYGRPLDGPRVNHWTLFVVAIVSLSVLLQLGAAALALRLIGITGRTPAWPLIAAALCLMAVRRLVPLYYFALSPAGYEPNIFSETVGALLSLLMFLGVVMIRPIFLERRRAEDERERMRGELLQAQKLESVGRLAGGIAHDFNNLLQGILGFAELLHDGRGGDEERRELALEIQKTGRRAADLTRHLLTFARKQAVVPERVDMNRSVEALMPFLRRLIGDKVEIDWRPGEELWPVWIDPVQVDQVVMNLAVNARDATEGTAGRIVISTGNRRLGRDGIPAAAEAEPGEFATLTVADNGRGMTRETLERIYEPFFTTKEKGRGTGLGLSSVYGVARQGRGFVTAESEPGKGASFTLHLPRHVAPATAPEAPPANARKNEGRGETILLVDDKRMLLAIGRRFLEGLGYAVLTAEGAEQALALLAERGDGVHLLVTDVRMPGLSGCELVARARRERAGLRHLYMSAYATGADLPVEDGLDDGTLLLRKPFTVDELAAKVRLALDREPATA